MNKYEVLYILQGDASDDAKTACADKFAALVADLGGTVSTVLPEAS